MGFIIERTTEGLAFNRTIVELKLSLESLARCSWATFNRTIVELKLVYCRSNTTVAMSILLIEPLWN